MFEPVRIELWRNGSSFSEFVARQPSDLNCRVEMMTGLGWVDVGDQHRMLIEMELEQLVQPNRVCNNYRKWGDLQQEVVEIEVRMQRMATEKEDLLMMEKLRK